MESLGCLGSANNAEGRVAVSLQRAAKATRPPAKLQRAAGTPHPRGTTFEFYKQVKGRWQLDAIFDDKGLALEEAKLFLARARDYVAVRVMAVEPHDAEFLESIIFRGVSGERGKPAAAGKAKITTNTDVVEHGVRRTEAQRQPFSFKALWRSPVAKVGAVLVLLVVVFAVLNHYNVQNHPSAFDSPEAQKVKSVRAPWNQ
jgi:hypothetical protein